MPLQNKKILCIGNNTEDTDIRVGVFAENDQLKNHGLISSADFLPVDFGYYHTTVVDVEPADIVQLATKFDYVLFIAQPVEEYDDPIIFAKTFKVLQDIEEQGIVVKYEDVDTVSSIKFFSDLLNNNRSFCIYPFIHLVEQAGNTTVCARSTYPIKKVDQIVDWATDPDYQSIRQNMLDGKKMPKHCFYCYKLESVENDKGVRFHDTIRWTTTLGIKTLDDLSKIKHPAYVEVRPSNRCNIRCRTCTPMYSHLIDREFKKNPIKLFDKTSWTKYSSFDIVDIDTIHTLYITGGEPTIMPELYEFLRRCIAQGRTDIRIMINTNAMYISDKLLELFSHFPKLGFSCSLDGVGKINDYIRWDSKFDQVVKNIKTLRSNGHHVAFISVISIYNVDHIGDLFEFFDKEFPGCPIQLQHGDFYGNVLDPYNRPDHQNCIDSMLKSKETKVYYNYSRGTKSIIDTMLSHYSKKPTINKERLQRFFEYNDQLDKNRGSLLIDYIPSLEKIRNIL